MVGCFVIVPSFFKSWEMSGLVIDIDLEWQHTKKKAIFSRHFQSQDVFSIRAFRLTMLITAVKSVLDMSAAKGYLSTSFSCYSTWRKWQWLRSDSCWSLLPTSATSKPWGLTRKSHPQNQNTCTGRCSPDTLDTLNNATSPFFWNSVDSGRLCHPGQWALQAFESSFSSTQTISADASLRANFACVWHATPIGRSECNTQRSTDRHTPRKTLCRVWRVLLSFPCRGGSCRLEGDRATRFAWVLLLFLPSFWGVV